MCVFFFLIFNFPAVVFYANLKFLIVISIGRSSVYKSVLRTIKDFQFLQKYLTAEDERIGLIFYFPAAVTLIVS